MADVAHLGKPGWITIEGFNCNLTLLIRGYDFVCAKNALHGVIEFDPAARIGVRVELKPVVGILNRAAIV